MKNSLSLVSKGALKIYANKYLFVPRFSSIFINFVIVHDTRRLLIVIQKKSRLI